MKLMSALRAATLLVPLSALAAATAQQEIQDALAVKPSLDRGAALFETCAACHGRSGTGTSDGDIPSIGGQHFKVIVRQLVQFQRGGRWDIRMSHFADQHHLTGAQAIADVAAYASSLPHPAWAKTGTGPGAFVDRGEGIYAQRCAGCHGRTAQGNSGAGVPQLAGQHYEYLRRQIYNAIDGERPGLAPSHASLLKPLEHDDIEGVADYLSRLPPRRLPGRHTPGSPQDSDLVP
jgi:cytochrome c553